MDPIDYATWVMAAVGIGVLIVVTYVTIEWLVRKFR